MRNKFDMFTFVVKWSGMIPVVIMACFMGYNVASRISHEWYALLLLIPVAVYMGAVLHYFWCEAFGLNTKQDKILDTIRAMDFQNSVFLIEMKGMHERLKELETKNENS